MTPFSRHASLVSGGSRPRFTREERGTGRSAFGVVDDDDDDGDDGDGDDDDGGDDDEDDDDGDDDDEDVDDKDNGDSDEMLEMLGL